MSCPRPFTKKRKDLKEVVGDLNPLGINPRNPRNRFQSAFGLAVSKSGVNVMRPTTRGGTVAEVTGFQRGPDMRNRMSRSVFVLGALALVAACGGGGSEKKADTQTTAATPKGNGNTFTIAMIAKSSTNPVFLAARTGAEAAAKDLSTKTGKDIRVNWLTPPQEDGQVQAQRVQQAVNDGADAILISCSDAGKVTGAINDAVGRGVPVMTFDSDAPASKRFAFYGVDDLKTGQLVMAELAKQLNGKGRVAILAGNQNAPNLQRRVQGAKDEAKKYPGIAIEGVFNHVETPQDAAAEVIRVNNAYPAITGWGFIGGWPLYTQTLLTDLNPAKQKVVSVDALPIE